MQAAHGAVEFDNISVDTNTLSTVDTNGSLIISPNGTGRIQVPYATADTVTVFDASQNIVSSAVTTTELGYLTGVTSAIQTQLNSASTTAAADLAAHEADTTSVHGIADSSALVTLAGSQTLTNKTLTSPVINSPTGIVKGDVGLGNVDNTSDATKNSAAVTLTNKTIDGDDNTLSDIGIASLKTDAAAASTFISRNGSGVVISTKAVPTGDVVGTSDTQGLTNKICESCDINIGLDFLDEAFARFYEDGAGTNYAAIKAPASLAGDYTLTLPPNDGNADDILKTDGSGGLSWIAPASSPVLPAPTIQTFTSSSGTYNKNYAFVISSGSATAGATYTNNSVTFTVYATVSSATLVYMSGSGEPSASGTLTKSTGTGDATLTFSEYKAPRFIRVSMVGGGGGGGGSSTNAASNGGAGGAGGATTFGAALLSAGGGGGASDGNTAAGGTASLGTGPIGIALSGASGLNGLRGPASVITAGNPAPGTPFGGGGGSSGRTNTGAGGAGGYTNGTASYKNVGGSGGAGGYVSAIIVSPSATYSYAVGAAGTAGAAGTDGTVGFAGGSGLIIVEEHYQ